MMRRHFGDYGALAVAARAALAEFGNVYRRYTAEVSGSISKLSALAGYAPHRNTQHDEAEP